MSVSLHAVWLAMDVMFFAAAMMTDLHWFAALWFGLAIAHAILLGMAIARKERAA